MLNEFPRAGYVTLVVPLDACILWFESPCVFGYGHCAVIHIGRTNYRIKVGDIIHWTGNHEIYWTPAGEEYEEPKPWRNGQSRKLFLDRIVSQQTHAL
jgi:hypothetical protein